MKCSAKLFLIAILVVALSSLALAQKPALNARAEAKSDAKTDVPARDSRFFALEDLRPA